MFAVIFMLFILMLMFAISPLFGALIIAIIVISFIYVNSPKLVQKIQNLNVNNQGGKGNSKTGIVVGIIGVIIFVVVIVVLATSPSSGGGKSKICQSCNREYTDSTNKNYIRHTNMCRLCYRNYCYSIGETPANYDK